MEENHVKIDPILNNKNSSIPGQQPIQTDLLLTLQPMELSKGV